MFGVGSHVISVSEPSDTSCFFANYSTTNANNPALNDTSYSANGVAKIYYTRSTRHFWTETLASGYAKGEGCSWNNAVSGTGDSTCSPVIGAHLHYQSSSGAPVAVVFCMFQPFPVNISVCPPQMANWNIGGLFNSAVNQATGGNISETTFMQKMDACASGQSCDVFYNIHTLYSITQTGGLGLAQAYLTPTAC